MTKHNQNIRWASGKDHDITFAIQDANGAAQDITGWTFAWKLARGEGQAALITKVATQPAAGTPEIEITNAVGGLGTIHILSTDTLPVSGTQLFSLMNRRYWHQLDSVDGSGTKSREFDGRAQIDRGIS